MQKVGKGCTVCLFNRWREMSSACVKLYIRGLISQLRTAQPAEVPVLYGEARGWIGAAYRFDLLDGGDRDDLERLLVEAFSARRVQGEGVSIRPIRMEF